MRRKVIAGNWKMNKCPTGTKKFLDEFIDLVKDSKNEIILCVPFIDLETAITNTSNTNIKVGAQNVHFEDKGAFTGEISPKMLSHINTEYVIIGHSERRQYYNETDDSVNLKIKASLANSLKPIVCVGESLSQREAGVTKDFVTAQIRNGLKNISMEEMKNIIIAYEPIWAIGTGKTASSDDANEVCKWIRDELNLMYGGISEEVIILYGGSVKSSNSDELFSMSDIDGGLVGGASLEPEEFAKIANFGM